MRDSYDQATQGVKRNLSEYPARAGIRHQRSAIVKDDDGCELAAYLHFPSDALHDGGSP